MQKLLYKNIGWTTSKFLSRRGSEIYECWSESAPNEAFDQAVFRFEGRVWQAESCMQGSGEKVVSRLAHFKKLCSQKKIREVR